MAKATGKEQYASRWKSEVAQILYGPVRDIEWHDKELTTQIREGVANLCDLIDRAAEVLDKEGVFDE